MNRHERMVAACERKYRETHGDCIDTCIGIGWCSDVYETANTKGFKDGFAKSYVESAIEKGKSE